MSRPLTGRIEVKGDRFQASVPSKKGSAQRISYTFDTREQAEAWRVAAVAAIAADAPVPGRQAAAEPHAQVTTNEEPTLAEREHHSRDAAVRTSVRTSAKQFFDAYYVNAQRAQLKRADAVRSNLEKIVDFFESRDIAMEEITVDHVTEFYRTLAYGTEHVQSAKVCPDLDVDRRVTMSETRTLDGIASVPTIKRRKGDGVLPYEVDSNGVHTFRVGDLVSAGLLRTGGAARLSTGPKRENGYCTKVRRDVRSTFLKMCEYAQAHLVAVNPRLSAVPLPKGDKPVSAKRRPITLPELARLAQQLHVVHQMVVMLVAFGALRMGEVFGLRVSDFTDGGPGEVGAVAVRRQGGSTFVERDPGTNKFVESSTKERLKTTQSLRTVVLPAALMDVVRLFIDVFHTDADGVVDSRARFIPGLQEVGESGIQAFRSALKKAAQATGVTSVAGSDDGDELVVEVRPKDFRATSITQVSQFTDVSEYARQRRAGHAPGKDVHAQAYILDDPELNELRVIAGHLDAMITDQMGGSVVVPTTLRCTTGAQKALASRADEIDAHLREVGWLITPTDEGQDLLDSDDVAAILQVSVILARRLLADGTIPSVPDTKQRGRGTQRWARPADVTAFKATRDSHVSLSDLAEELTVSYERVHRFVSNKQMTLRPVGREHKAVSPEDQAAIRAHFRGTKERDARVAPTAEVMRRLNVSKTRVDGLVAAGELTAGDRLPDGRRTVTRDSLREYEAKMAARAKKADRQGAVSWGQACEITGLSPQHLEDLVSGADLEAVYVRRKRHVTLASLVGYLARTDPGRLMLPGATG